VQFADLNGIVIHHQVIAAAAGKPKLVFANSLGTDFRIWRDVVVRLAGDFSVLMYDMRGHGLSDTGTPPYRIEDLSADLAALIEHTGFGPAIVCGVSVGGLTAQSLAVERPDLVRALILCDTAPKVGTSESWDERTRVVREGGIEVIADKVLGGWLTEQWRTSEKAALAGYRNMLTRTPVDGYLGTVAALRAADLTEAVRTIAVPALCVVGEEDKTTTPEMVGAMAKSIPGARYEVIRNAGHIPSIEQPEALAAMIRAFADFVGAESNGAKRH
jgi:3-oxoadipate enol-lactonase